MESLAFHSLLIQMKDDHTNNSHHLTYAFVFERLGKFTLFELGMKNGRVVSVIALLFALTDQRCKW